MKVNDRTGYIISAIAVGVSILGFISGLILAAASVGKKPSTLLLCIGLGLSFAGMILFQNSGVAKDRLVARFRADKKTRLMTLLVSYIVFFIIAAVVALRTPKPLHLFLILSGILIATLVVMLIVFYIVGKKGYPLT